MVRDRQNPVATLFFNFDDGTVSFYPKILESVCLSFSLDLCQIHAFFGLNQTNQK